MNKVDRVLSDDLARRIDRLAATVPEDALERIRAATPTLRARLEEMEASLAATRESLVEDYARWTRLLEDLENIWALAAWRSAVEEPAQSAPRLAA